MLSIAGDATREFAPGAAEQVLLQVRVPAGTPAGPYSVRLDAVSETSPDEDFTEGPSVAFDVVQAAPKPPWWKKWWWVILIAVILLVIVIALVVWLLVRGGGGSTTTTTAHDGSNGKLRRRQRGGTEERGYGNGRHHAPPSETVGKVWLRTRRPARSRRPPRIAI